MTSSPVLDANGTPVSVPADLNITDEFRAFMATRVPAPECPHYINAREAKAGFKQCERCQHPDLVFRAPAGSEIGAER